MSDSFGLGPGPLSRPEPVEPPRRSGGVRFLLWLLVIFVIVAVALTGGAYAAGLIGGDDDPAAAPTGAPTGGDTRAAHLALRSGLPPVPLTNQDATSRLGLRGFRLPDCLGEHGVTERRPDPLPTASGAIRHPLCLSAGRARAGVSEGSYRT